MAIELNRTSIFTVKYLDTGGVQQFADFQAVGTSDAQEQFKTKFPDCQVINVWRKA
jgi:hypothetical protein